MQLRGLAPRVLQPQLRMHIVDLPRPRQHKVPHAREGLFTQLQHISMHGDVEWQVAVWLQLHTSDILPFVAMQLGLPLCCCFKFSLVWPFCRHAGQRCHINHAGGLDVMVRVTMGTPARH